MITETLLLQLKEYEGKWVALAGSGEEITVVGCADCMRFSYEKQRDIRNPQLPWSRRPAVRVQLSYGDRYQSVMALIDSGAEITLFHISLAKQLDINSFQGEATVFGISGELMPVYFQRLKLKLEGTTKPIEVEAAFVDSPGVGALLGQAGFFEHFRICFDRSKEEVEIRSTRLQ